MKLGMVPGSYKQYMLVMMMAILASNYVDRYVLGLLLQEIKVDLSLSDTQLGLLSGFAFALFYSLMGVPIARWADRGDRVLIISIATGAWSVAVAFCGMAGTFLQLLAIRVCAAIGEAGFAPPSHSLIADYFRREERAKAISIFKLGIPLGVIVGYMSAGWLNEAYGWRATFILMGSPGVVLAILTYTTLREPRRTSSHRALAARSENSITATGTPPISHDEGFRAVVRTLRANRTFCHLTISYALVLLFGHGIGKWQPSFFIRSHGMETGQLGTWLALVNGGAGLVGIYLGGFLASRYAVNNERLQLKFMAATYFCFGVLATTIYLVPDRYSAFALMAVLFAGGYAVTPPLFATLQTLVPDRMRATSLAIVYLVANLFGAGLGPLFAGLLSDLLRPTLGVESLRYALVALCPGYILAGWHLWRAQTTVTGDLETAQRFERAPG